MEFRSQFDASREGRFKTTTPTVLRSGLSRDARVTRSTAAVREENMADAEAARSLSGLLNGVAQKVYFGKAEITEELLKEQLFPELSPEDFRALYERMSGLLKVQKRRHPAGRQGELHLPLSSSVSQEQSCVQWKPTDGLM